MIGHNSQTGEINEAATAAANELRLFVERVERLEEEKKGIADDIKDVMAEMKGRGYDTGIVRKLLKIRKMKPGEYQEQEMLIETYLSALAML